MDQRCYITWSSQPPSVINFNPTQSYFFGYGIVASPARTSNHQDVRNLASCLVTNEVLPLNNVFTFPGNSSDFRDSYTSAKLAKIFKFQASNVESDGIFMLYYSGPGYKINEQLWSLGSSDFDARDHTTHITADTIVTWLVATSCRAKHVVVVLNCTQGGRSIAAALTDRLRNQSGVSLCVLSVSGDPPSLFTSLEASVSNYFLCAAISKLHVGQGVLQLTNIYDFTAHCCEAFFRLIVTYDPVTKRADLHEAQPTLSALGKPRLVEITSSEETDNGPPGEMQFLSKYFHPGMAGAPLHQYAYDWLQRVANVGDGPLTDLHRLGVLRDDAVTCAAICVMMQALAALQMAFGDAADADSPNRLLVAFTAVAASVSSISRDSAEVEERHFRLAWKSYCETIENSGLTVPNIRKMLENV